MAERHKNICMARRASNDGLRIRHRWAKTHPLSPVSHVETRQRLRTVRKESFGSRKIRLCLQPRELDGAADPKPHCHGGHEEASFGHADGARQFYGRCGQRGVVTTLGVEWNIVPEHLAKRFRPGAGGDHNQIKAELRSIVQSKRIGRIREREAIDASAPDLATAAPEVLREPGHELSRIDRMGVSRDKIAFGKLRGKSWFERADSCAVNRFGDHPVPELQIPFSGRIVETLLGLIDVERALPSNQVSETRIVQYALVILRDAAKKS